MYPSFSTSYIVDECNRIESIDEAWSSFAKRNKAQALTGDATLCQDINSFISCKKSQELYDMLMHTVRTKKKVIEFPFRCDSPEVRRFMRMEMIPLDNEKIAFKSSLEREEAREPLALLDISTERTIKIITICSWCKRIKQDELHWLSTEDAVEHMGLFGKKTLPMLSHGICPGCCEGVMEKIS